ncbi:MAG: oligosaccharide repeat unit polymerase [Prevotellaceae bacterium]|jgi:oligosaccharide repeat unit polymerase|nr:oligosaccharide repeat unit polymerase [Prevotellaceae bacterium]
MKQDIWQNSILTGNALVYTLTMLYFWRKSKVFNTSVFLLLLYTVSAWAAILYYNHELFFFSSTLRDGNMFGKITVEPFVWLYTVLMLFMYPFLKIRSDKISKIVLPSKNRLMIFVQVATVLNILGILLLIPELQKLSGEWMDIRQAQMTEEGVNYWFTGTILSQLFGLGLCLCSINIVLSFFLFMVKPFRSKWSSIYFYTTILFNVMFNITLSGRGMILMIFVYLFCIFLLFKNFISSKSRKKTMRWMLVAGILVVAFFIIVTLSRYGDMVMFSIWRYAGEPMLNFNAVMYNNLKGTTDGDAYFNIFTKYFHPEEIEFTGTDKWHYIMGKTGVDAHIFYTFAGALCFDLGKMGVLITALLFCIASSIILRRANSNLSVGVIVYYAVMMYMFILGVFLFIFQGANGNFTLIMAFLMLWYLKPSRNGKNFISNTQILIRNKKGTVQNQQSFQEKNFTEICKQKKLH